MTRAPAERDDDNADEFAKGEVALELAKLNLEAALDGWTDARLERLEQLLDLQAALEMQAEDFIA